MKKVLKAVKAMTLKGGMVFLLASSLLATTVNTEAASASSCGCIKVQSYIIVPSDTTMEQLAMKYKVSLQLMQAANETEISFVKKGTRIAIPASIEATKFVAKKMTVKDAPNGLNVRKAASTKSVSIGKLPNGTAVTVVGISVDWAEIQFNKGKGFVHMDYLAEIAAPKKLSSALYKAEKGDTVGSISSRFGISAATFKKGNKMTSDNIVAGKSYSVQGAILEVRGTFLDAEDSHTIHVAVNGKTQVFAVGYNRSGNYFTYKKVAKSYQYTVVKGRNVLIAVK